MSSSHKKSKDAPTPDEVLKRLAQPPILNDPDDVQSIKSKEQIQEFANACDAPTVLEELNDLKVFYERTNGLHRHTNTFTKQQKETKYALNVAVLDLFDALAERARALRKEGKIMRGDEGEDVLPKLRRLHGAFKQRYTAPKSYGRQLSSQGKKDDDKLSGDGGN